MNSHTSSNKTDALESHHPSALSRNSTTDRLNSHDKLYSTTDHLGGLVTHNKLATAMAVMTLTPNLFLSFFLLFSLTIKMLTLQECVGMSSCTWSFLFYFLEPVCHLIQESQAVMEASPHWQFVSVDLAIQFSTQWSPVAQS